MFEQFSRAKKSPEESRRRAQISAVIPNYINITLSQASEINLPSKLIVIVGAKV
jgi:hypothetical protein